MVVYLKNVALRLVSIALFSALAACGGGGGGGGGGSSDAFSLSTSNITFTAIQGGTPGSQTVGVTVNSGMVFILATPSGGAPFTSRFDVTGQNTGVITITPNAASMSPGSYSGTVTVRGCTNLGCSAGSDVAGSPKTIYVTYNIGADIAVSPTAINITYVTGSANPAAQSVNVVTAGGVSWTASANQPWLSISSNNGVGSGTISATINPGGLAVGTYYGTITFTASSSGETATVLVTLSIAVPAITTSSGSLIYTGIYGASSVPSQTVSMAMNNGAAVNWTATAGAAWLGLSSTSGTTPDTLSISVNPSGLGVGTHTSTITITGTGLSGPTTIDVTFNLYAPTMSMTPGSLSFGGVHGGLDTSGKTAQISLNTGANAYGWSASSPDAWLQVTPAAGSVSATPATVTVTVNPAGLVEGVHNGSIIFTALVNGVTVNRTVPVDLRLNTHKILSSDAGVALTSTPSLSKLTQTLRVRSNRGATINWSAVSDQAWLSVTPSGTTADNLVVTAAPGALAANTIHYANISITSDDVSVQNTEMVRVGLWVGSSTPATMNYISTPTVAGRANKAVADPIRPYLYYHNGGSNISVFNVYTGAVVTTIASVASHLGDMAIANDGSRLYVLNNALFTIIPIDLGTLTPGTAWPIGNQVYTHLDYVRTDGIGLVISGNGRIFNAATGIAYSTSFYVQANANAIVETSLDGSRLCSLDVSYLPYTVRCYSLFYSTANGGEVQLGATRSMQGDANSTGVDLAISADGTRVYVPSYIFSGVYYGGAANDIRGYDPTGATMTVVQNLTIGSNPTNVELARDGRIFTGKAFSGSGVDVTIYNSSGSVLSSHDVSGYYDELSPDKLTISSDDLRMITITGTSSSITTIGP